MEQLTVRPPEEEELPALAELRWEWIREKGETPAIDRDEFRTEFVRWTLRNTASHRPMVLLRGREVIGMAWLALLPRVPTPHSVERWAGDVQCVYVVPQERNRGHGGRLVTAVLRLAEELGLVRVTVHSSDRAIPVYQRHGFSARPRLLQADVPTPTS
ncbi:GNAT family N-acetyltransferase [Saccharomonospora halophila]|uniref:GNAT family N-acetyltransferase n=1 Tax=Saccharomonospora halophila TaxID=129922 RepID=UPI00036C0094|nr:GNAT family N-acetyltransferase [Saccharomonospora halophila]